MLNLNEEELLAGVQKGRWAKSFLEDENVNQLIAELRESYHNQWEYTVDREERDYIWSLLRGLQAFVQSVKALVDFGQACETELEQRRKSNA